MLLTAGVGAEVSRSGTLTTTGDPTRYSVFIADGDVIKASGRYADDPIVAFDVTAVSKKTSTDFKTGADGTYEAVFKGACLNDYSVIRLITQSGHALEYRVDYDNGWYFADNGLGGENAFFTENYEEIDPSIVRMYLVNEDGTDGDLEQTLSRIKNLADALTEGLDGDYDKARAISAYVAESCYYDYAARDSEVTLDTIALNRVLDAQRTVCSGYANLTAALLEAAGIKAVTVIGAAASFSEYPNLSELNRHHEWTAFYYAAEDRWVIIDSGWDSGNIYRNGRYETDVIAKKYFDISPLAFSQNHRADRAEHRDYFSEKVYAAASEPTIAETTAETAASETDGATLTDVSEITLPTETPESKSFGSGNTGLYIAIALISAGIVIIAVMLIRSGFK